MKVAATSLSFSPKQFAVLRTRSTNLETSGFKRKRKAAVQIMNLLSFKRSHFLESSMYLYSPPPLSLQTPSQPPSLLIPNLHPIRISPNIRINRLLDRLALPAGNPQNQIVQRAAAQDIYMVSCRGTPARAEAVGLVPHFDDSHGDLRRVVARHAPAAVAHVPAGEEVDGPVAFAHDDAVVDEVGRGGDCGVCSKGG